MGGAARSFLEGIVYQNDILTFWRIRRGAFSTRGTPTATTKGDLRLRGDSAQHGRAPDRLESLEGDVPSGLNQDQQDTVNRDLMREPAPQTGRVAALLPRVYGRILDRYRGFANEDYFRAAGARSNSPPRRPGAEKEQHHPRLCVLSAQRSAVRRTCLRFTGTPGIVPRRAALESCGIALFSPMLAEDIGRMLGTGARR